MVESYNKSPCAGDFPATFDYQRLYINWESSGNCPANHGSDDTNFLTFSDSRPLLTLKEWDDVGASLSRYATFMGMGGDGPQKSHGCIMPNMPKGQHVLVITCQTDVKQM